MHKRKRHAQFASKRLKSLLRLESTVASTNFASNAFRIGLRNVQIRVLIVRLNLPRLYTRM